MMDFKAAIFDFDGTLVDSMWVWDRLLIDFLARHGYETPEDVLSTVAFMTLKQSSEYVAGRFRLPMSGEEIRQEWTGMVYDCYAHRVRPKPGAAAYLKKLKESGVRVGIATACDRELCEAALKHGELLPYVDTITYADEVGKGKESPDVYLECLRRLDTEPKDAMLYEDILTALRTGRSIGLRVTIVEDRCAEKDRVLLKQEADTYIQDFLSIL